VSTPLPLLDVSEIHTAYGLSRVLFGVSVEVRAGECVCLLGRNGVGKSTTMRSIIGLTPPQEGRVMWKGTDITGWPPYRVARAGIGFVPEDRRIFADLTVWENLDVAARNRKAARDRQQQHAEARRHREERQGGEEQRGLEDRQGREERQQERSREPSISAHPRPEPSKPPPLQWTTERVFDLFPKLRDLSSRNGGFLSGGEQQMLTIARTLMGNPELLLLDEPSEGLAPLVVDHLAEQIGRLKREGLTILLAEQNVEFSLALAERVYVLEKGSIRFSGPAQRLRQDDTLRHELLAL
jgi:branched-chain amino acid transport system ATP-binding protein